MIMMRASIRLLLAMVLLVGIATPVWAGYAEGKAAFDKSDYETAFEAFRPLAMDENSNAQYHLGLFYRNGWGVPQDDSEAARWLRLAAYQGHVEAQYILGYMYEHGQGLSKDLIEAKNWYRMAASQGDTDAQHNLGIINFEEQSAAKSRRDDQGVYAMSANPGDWFDSVLGLLIGLEDTMTVSDILLIAAIILIIVVPVVMPFSFYRIKPLLHDISERAAERDRALLEEISKIAPLLRQTVNSTAERDQALLDEFRKLTHAIDEETRRQEAGET